MFSNQIHAIFTINLTITCLVCLKTWQILYPLWNATREWWNKIPPLTNLHHTHCDQIADDVGVVSICVFIIIYIYMCCPLP